MVSDILISNDLALHNLSLLTFFQESLAFIFAFNTKFYQRKNFFSLIDFYFKSPFLDDANKLKSLSGLEADSKILKAYGSNFFKI